MDTSEPTSTRRKGTPREPETIDGRTLALVPTPRRRKPKLTTLDGVRTEMSRIYREMESGKRDSGEGGRLIYALIAIGKVLEVADLERRVDELERRRAGRQLPGAPTPLSLANVSVVLSDD